MSRIALYSHDTFGLGHFRRCLKLGRAIRDEIPEASGLFLTGSPWADRFELPLGFTTRRLTPVIKRGRGTYASRDASRPFDEVLEERRESIRSALEAFEPDLLIVDNVPCGLKGEIAPVLESNLAARRVLALRDVLDDPAEISQEWRRSGAERAVSEHYDEVWLFGEQDDLERSLSEELLDSMRHKIVVCGHIGSGRLLPARRGRKDRDRPRVLVTCGGGGDAVELILTYLRALELGKRSLDSRLVLGPDFPLERLPKVAAEVEILRFDPDLERSIADADLLVSMAGYNTVCEIREAGSRAVLVPRVTPRLEQFLRSERLARRGRVAMIHPRDLTPETLIRAIDEVLEQPAPFSEKFVGGWMAARRARLMITSALAQAV